MRKIVVTEFMSLDGVIENPAWSLQYWNDEIANFKQSELWASDAMLLGRVTYEGFAQAWPSRTDEQGYADKFNSMPKYVVTTTLDTLDWNNSHAISTNIVDEISALKGQPGQDIVCFGSGRLVNYLIEHNLVDQYNILTYPVVLGTGQKLFLDGTKTKLNLVEGKSLPKGVILSVYQTEQS